MMIAKLRRTQFGRSFEQMDAMIDRLQLSLKELEVSQAEVLPITEPAPCTVSRRKPLPEHLPREINVLQPESQCSGCGGTLRQLGEDVSEVEVRSGTFQGDSSLRALRPGTCAEPPDSSAY